MASTSRKLGLGEEEHAWLARAFRKMDFFAGLTLGQLELILPNIERHLYDAGAAVIDAGDEPKAVYIVYQGAVIVKRKFWLLGRFQEVARMGPGELFGEIAILEGRRHRARVEAEGSAEVFALQSRHFRYVLERNPGLADRFKAIAAHRLLGDPMARAGSEA